MTEIAHADRTHALLSASSSKIWLTCTPSARLSESFPDQQTEYTQEGTLAHEMAELMMRKACVEPMGPRKFNAAMKKLEKQLKEHENWDQGMRHHVETYHDYIMGIVHKFDSPPYVAVERRLDYSAWAPDGFGTGDCIIIGGNTLYVIDLKFGKGVPVSAEENTQMRLYALGAYAAYSFLYDIQNVQMTIIQPRLDNISEDTMNIADLLAWGESVKPLAQKAFKGEGDFVPGEHCSFCRAKATCRARSEQNLQLQGFHKMKPPLITNEEVGKILEQARDLSKWVSDLEEYALSQCLAGIQVEGWKAVEGRSSRQYANIDEAFKVLTANGIQEAMLYERKPLTPPNVEKLVGKAKFKELLVTPGLVEAKPGKPTLVPARDKRDAITNKVSAAEAFQN